MRRMTLAKALQSASTHLRAAGIDDAQLEAELLLRHALGVSREQLFARLQEPLPASVTERYDALLTRRLAREPSAYITGHREFYGLDFACSPDALIPRPETELLVETAIGWTRRRAAANAQANFEPRTSNLTPLLLLADIGTGCGAIAVALAVHLPNARVVGSDVSLPALQLARRNAEAQGVADRIDFVQASMLAGLRGRFGLIAANLPYIPNRTYAKLPPEIREHEPPAALRAGRRGTALIEALLTQAASRLRPGGLLLAEHAWNQGGRLRDAACESFPMAAISTRRDLAGRERMLVVQLERQR